MKATFPLVLVLSLSLGVLASRWFGKRTDPSASTPAAAQSAPAPAAPRPELKTEKPAAPSAAAAQAASEPLPSDVGLPNHPEFRLRPFPVVKTSATHQWTDIDGLSDAAIHALAHNYLEEEAYKEENKWTERRQLVYRNEYVGDFFAQIESGTRTQIVVPGLDGREFVVDLISYARFNDGGGSVHGIVRNSPGSTVGVGFAQGREAMEIHLPAEDLVYQIKPREDNEIVISQVNLREQSKHGEPLKSVNSDDVGQPLQ